MLVAAKRKLHSFRRKLQGSVATFGTWVSSGHPDSVDVLKHLNFDWFVFDSEHSAIGPETIKRMVQTLGENGAAPLVRVGINDQYLIKLALDAGAQGVVVPLVNSKGEAERVIDSCMYPPLGSRGTASSRASHYGIDAKEYLRTANDKVVVIVQIETVEALENLDDILNVKRLDVAFAGPSDLTMSLGLIDDRTNPKVLDAMKKVVDGCIRHGKVPGTMATSKEEVARAIEMGSSSSLSGPMWGS